MALARNRRDRQVDYWPGFVDALSTLLLSIMFLLSVFVLAQYLLSRELSGKDDVLDRLNSQITELTKLWPWSRPASRIWKTRWPICKPHSKRQKAKSHACKHCSAKAQVPALPCHGKAIGSRKNPGIRKADQPAGAEPGRICSTSRSQRCAPRSPRWKTRSTRPKTATASPTPRSLISASASMSRWRSACRNSTATAPISSAACAKFSPTAKTSASSATVSSSRPKCCSPRSRSHQ